MPDLMSRFRFSKDAEPVPPPFLRARVGRDSSRGEYFRSGSGAAKEIIHAFQSARDEAKTYPLWLDFGCGSARLYRYVDRYPECQNLIGVDVDARAIAWCKKYLSSSHFFRIPHEPPTHFPDASFDVVFAASIFTHFDEKKQFLWLEEIQRILKPAGLLIASTHGTDLIDSRPDISASESRSLSERGFAFVEGFGPFNESTAFHSKRYLERHWGEWFTLKWFSEKGLFRYQDVGVWETPVRPASP